MMKKTNVKKGMNNNASLSLVTFQTKYYGIAAKYGHDVYIIWGADSAWEDNYEVAIAKDVLKEYKKVLAEANASEKGRKFLKVLFATKDKDTIESFFSYRGDFIPVHYKKLKRTYVPMSKYIDDFKKRM